MDVKFKDPSVVINIQGQRFHQGNITQADYDYLVSWSASYADYFVPVEEKTTEEKTLKPKTKKDGKEEGS